MARLMDPFLQELKQESASTRRLLERVPEDKYDWKPHAKSMPLGILAMHIAILPGRFSQLLSTGEFPVPATMTGPSRPSSGAELMSEFEQSIRSAEQFFSAMTDQDALSTWRMTRDGKELMSMPKIAVVRTIMFNHLYHHRGQLTVYLRLLDVLLPATYGSSADENPFGLKAKQDR